MMDFRLVRSMYLNEMRAWQILGARWSNSRLTTDTQDHFGGAVAINGNTMVIGAKDDDDLGGASGSAYVFQRDPGNNNSWRQVAKLVVADGKAGDNFGTAVGIDHDTIVVGVPKVNAAYLFGRNIGGTNAWAQIAKIKATDSNRYDEFGYAVSISADTVLVGAKSSDALGTNSGAAYVFGRNVGGQNAWGQVTKLTRNDTRAFGWSVALSGNKALVGAPFSDVGLPPATYAGTAYLLRQPLLRIAMP